jgi:4-phytase/acid phosphatase
MIRIISASHRHMLATLTLRLGLAALAAIPVASLHAHAVKSERVVMQIALIRHGIRSPTAAPDALAVYAAKPWPAWPVAPGQLTTHGAQLMRSLGAWYRHDLSQAGIALGTCDDTQLKLIADSTPRNRDSAAAMLGGLLPACPIRYHAFAPDHPDPLFRGSRDGDDDVADTTSPALPMLALTALQQALLGCHDRACLADARTHDKKVLLGDDPAKALKHAGTLSENLMLEYVEGLPLAQVGWGRLDAAGIGRIIVLHNASFAFSKKSPASARARDGNMLAHIAATLSAAAGQPAKLPALSPPGAHALVLIGHDTDLASQAALLGVDWHRPQQPDDYPPGGTLIYQLIESQGHYAVRVRVALPTLAALRAADVGTAGAMRVTTLQLPDCNKHGACSLAEFQVLVTKAINDLSIVAGTGNEPRVQ